MANNVFPENELRRIEKLKSYELMGLGKDPELDVFATRIENFLVERNNRSIGCFMILNWRMRLGESFGIEKLIWLRVGFKSLPR